MKSKLVRLGVALAMGGCVAEPVLIPARGVSVAGEDSSVAVIEEVGVRLFVNGDAWRGEPRDLTTLMTPLKVALENHSGVRLRIAYQDISLLGASGFRYPALAPMTGEPKISEAVPNASGSVLQGTVIPAAVRRVYPRPRFHHDRFLIARHNAPLYPGFPAWSLAFPYDPFYYQRYQDIWPTQLPTQDMLAEALPEGVLEAGGRVDGFIYFQNVTKEANVRFEMKLVDATNGGEVGVLSVPFAVGRR